jgi:hypothetical protein
MIASMYLNLKELLVSCTTKSVSSRWFEGDQMGYICNCWIHSVAMPWPSNSLVYLKVMNFLVAAGAVVHEAEGPTPDSQYEHSSLPATVKKIFNLKDDFLTARDAWAGTFEHILSQRTSPRKDCPSMKSPALTSSWTVFLAFSSIISSVITGDRKLPQNDR